MSAFTFRSGKHIGKSLQLVEKIDPKYIIWIKENCPKMLEETKVKVIVAPTKSVDGNRLGKLEPNIDFLSQPKE